MFMMFLASCNAQEDTVIRQDGPDPVQTRLIQAGLQVLKEPVAAPDFTLPSVTGEKITLSSLKGKIVLLNFWATWCPPCRIEMPSMQRLYDELKDEGFELIAVNLQEPEETVKRFLLENGYDFPVLLDTRGGVGALYGVRSIPQTFLIDAEGFAVAGLTGAREWDSEDLYSALRSMLPGK